MKVSEAIDQLRCGDEIWVKMEITSFDFGTSEPVRGRTAKNIAWLNEDDEISLTEPKPELAEVPQFVADWFEANKDALDMAIWTYINDYYEMPDDEFDDWLSDEDNNPIITLVKMQDGYIVKQEPKWAISYRNSGNNEMYLLPIGLSIFPDGNLSPTWGNKAETIVFDDKAKAETLAALINGKVEEV